MYYNLQRPFSLILLPCFFHTRSHYEHRKRSHLIALVIKPPLQYCNRNYPNMRKFSSQTITLSFPQSVANVSLVSAQSDMAPPRPILCIIVCYHVPSFQRQAVRSSWRYFINSMYSSYFIQNIDDGVSTHQICSDALCRNSTNAEISTMDEGSDNENSTNHLSLRNSSRERSMDPPPVSSFSSCTPTPSPSVVVSTRNDSSVVLPYHFKSFGDPTNISTNATPSSFHRVVPKFINVGSNSSGSLPVSARVSSSLSMPIVSSFNRSSFNSSMLSFHHNPFTSVLRNVSPSPKHTRTYHMSRNSTRFIPSFPRIRIYHISHNTTRYTSTRVSSTLSSPRYTTPSVSYPRSNTPNISSTQSNVMHKSYHPYNTPSISSPRSNATFTPRKRTKRSRKSPRPLSFPPIIPCSEIQFYDWRDSIGTPPLPLSSRLP